MEKMVVNRLVYYLEKNKTGFRPGRSALDQLMRLQDTINKYNSNRGYTVGVFIDFQSAYDMLWHDGLMIKLKKLGIDGEIFHFIRNFLIGRTMQVKVGNQLSQSMTIENGTPQGSVLDYDKRFA